MFLDTKSQIEPTKIKSRPYFLFFSKLSEIYYLHPFMADVVCEQDMALKHPSRSFVDYQIHLKLDKYKWSDADFMASNASSANEYPSCNEIMGKKIINTLIFLGGWTDTKHWTREKLSCPIIIRLDESDMCDSITKKTTWIMQSRRLLFYLKNL